MAEAGAAAMKAGFCKGKVCTLEEIKAWARKHGKGLGGALGVYAAALAGKAGSADEAAAVVAKALGLSKEELLKLAQDAAKKAGFCKADKCTAEELAAWAKAQGKDLPAPLGAIARLLVPKINAR